MNKKPLIILGSLLFAGVVFAASITKFYGDIDMQSHKITNLATPTANADGATKAYVDTQISSTAITLLPLSGGTMSGAINMGGKKITNLATPTATTDASTKGYVDDEITTTQDLVDTAALYASNYTTRVSVNATNYTDRAARYATNYVNATKATIDTSITNLWKGVYKRLKLSGGTMSGDLDMNFHYIDKLNNPQTARQAVNLQYLKSNFLPIAGTGAIDTNYHATQAMGGSINMGNHQIFGLPSVPDGSDRATSKSYVDKGDNTNKTNMYAELGLVNTKITSGLYSSKTNMYAEVGKKLSLSGGQLTGQLSMSGQRIYNLSDPVLNQDAATKNYVNSVINNANAYQYFALKKGSGYTPIYHLSSNTNRQFSVVVLRQFEGSITSYVENIHGIASQHYRSKTWKVGETIKVPFGLGPETFVETNGTLIVKGPSGVLGNFGITAPPNGISPFTCDLIVNGTTYAPNTSLSLNAIWDNANKCFTFKLKNTSGRTISNAVITAPSVIQYVSSVPYSSTHLYFVDPGTYSIVPGTLTISSWANNMELTFKLYVIDIDNDYGFRWNFNISADGQSYDYGQFFFYIP